MRYLTRRFIGEYRSNTDLLYRQTIALESGLLDVEIVDISAENDNDFPIEQVSNNLMRYFMTQFFLSFYLIYIVTDTMGGCMFNCL